MRVAIDINDVLRDFTKQFAKTYQKGYDHTFDLDNVEFWTNELDVIFPFKSKKAYSDFTYVNFAYELFGCAPVTNNQLVGLFNDWVNKVSEDTDTEFIIVSPMEMDLSIPSTLFFLSKVGSRIREIYFPTDSAEIWDKCDVLITANPILLNLKPEGKISIKIAQDYNRETESDYSFSSMKKLVENENNIEKIIEKNGK